jgi:predicted transport protein
MNSRTNIKEQVIRQDQRILVHTQNIYVAYLLWQNFMETNILPTGQSSMYVGTELFLIVENYH